MSRPRRLPLALPLALAAALSATGCIGVLRRSMAPEQRVSDPAAARTCAAMIASELGYLAGAELDQAPDDATGQTRFVAERRGGTPDGQTVIDQLAVTVLPGNREKDDTRGRLRVAPARFVEDAQQALSPARGVPRLRPPGPAEGASRLQEQEGVRRRRVSSSVPRRDAAEVLVRCAR
jgi:hypothetical protein